MVTLGRLRGSSISYLLEDEAAPLGPVLLEEDPPLMPPVLEDVEPPLLLGELEDDEPPAGGLIVPPAPLGLELELDEPGDVEDELDEPGAGATVVEDEDDPPGTTIVSFSLVTVLVGGLPPGTTVVVSFFSHAERARAPANANR